MRRKVWACAHNTCIAIVGDELPPDWHRPWPHSREGFRCPKHPPQRFACACGRSVPLRVDGTIYDHVGCEAWAVQTWPWEGADGWLPTWRVDREEHARIEAHLRTQGVHLRRRDPLEQPENPERLSSPPETKSL